MVVELPCQERYIDTIDFSSDASIFLIGSQDGKISLFKLSDFSEESLQPYHEWFPHGSSELSASHVVDFKTAASPSGYLISGTHFNSELCLWRLHDYSLVQSIRFRPTDEQNQSDTQKAQPSLLITCFDRTNNLLFASDIKRTVLYVLHLARNPERDDEVMFRCVSEFLLVNPCIAFDVSRVSRTLSLSLPIVDCESLDADNIEVLLAAIYPGELQIGKLRFSVPMSTYLNNAEDALAEPVGCGDEPSVVSASTPTPTTEVTPLPTDLANPESDHCPSPVLPEYDVIPIAGKETDSPNDTSPFPPSEMSDAVPKILEISTTLPGSENSSSSDSATPQGHSENEADVAHPRPHSNLSTSVCSDATAPPPPPRSLLSMHKKASDSVPNNMDSASRRSPSPNSSEVCLPTGNRGDQNDDEQFLGVGRRQGELSDSVRSLAGSSSSSSLEPSNSGNQPMSRYVVLDGRALRKSKNPKLAGDVPESNRSSRLASSASALNLGRFDASGSGGPKLDFSRPLLPSMIPLPGFLAEIEESNRKVEKLIKNMEAIDAELKAYAKALTTLLRNVQENKSQLKMLAEGQDIIANQVNHLVNSTSPPSAVNPPASTAAAALAAAPLSPSIFTTPITDEKPGKCRSKLFLVVLVHLELSAFYFKAKVEIVKRLSELEGVLKSINISGHFTGTTGASSAAKTDAGLDSKQLKAYQDQTRGMLRTELQNVFRTNTAKIVDPLRQSVTRSVEEAMKPIPKMVADQIARVINDPNFLQYLSGTMGAVITPSMANAYREELKSVLAPAFTDSIEKLVRDTDALIRSGFNRHLQMVTSKVDSGVQSSRDKTEAAMRKLDEAVDKVTREFTVSSLASTPIPTAALQVTLAKKMNEAAQRFQQLLQAQQKAPPAAAAAVTSKETLGKGPKGTNKQQAAAAVATAPTTLITSKLQPLSPDALESYRNATDYIQKNQYTKALETALTSTNQTVLLLVLQDLPVVQLFQQGVGQDLLLSLIHQLSCGNLQDQLELKISFLQEAVNHLRVHDSTVVEFGGNILSMLVSKISALRSGLQLSPAEENRAAALLRSVLNVQVSLPMKQA
ncbi:unnamed protein product [Mesocestoides corti]|uniref:Enhancer of mRNA-decapping protein 4 WD40 repeat region domain-containing protein n=1 Tax=Mesocestoides corti TaxID=53468 RepID=A0A0R3UIP6_MESCO|nr:unnamed protein product [Mesocestoides corti]